MKFSILGCGWLGFPLAKHFIQHGFEVNGSTTSTEKTALFKKEKINPFALKIENDELIGDFASFLNADILCISIPFGQQKDNFDGYKKLVKLLEKSVIKKILFISSTSVYPDLNTTITENTEFKVHPPKKVLLDLENLFLNNPYFKTTVVRFSGLIGGTRNPGNFFKSERIVQNGLAPVNLIHLDDCIGILHKIVLNNCWNTVFNAAANTHPTRKDFYTAATIKQEKTPATFVENKGYPFKVISNEKLKAALNYSFVYGDLMELVLKK